MWNLARVLTPPAQAYRIAVHSMLPEGHDPFFTPRLYRLVPGELRLAPRALAFYNSPMDCPACKTPLMVLEFDGVEVDHCVACGGVWLDASEVELLFGDEEASTAFLHTLDPGAVEKDRRLRCPISGKPMRKGHIGGGAAVTYDYSPHGLWFDRGELAAVLRAEALEPGTERVAAWLRQVFPQTTRQESPHA